MPMIKPVITIKKPKLDFTFASAATARNMKKLASRRIWAIIEFTSSQPSK